MAKKNNKTTKKKISDRRRPKSTKKQHLENTDMWHLCKAGSFSYGESPRTPPLEGSSLQWQKQCGETQGYLQPVYLFTITIKWIHLARDCDTDKCSEIDKSGRCSYGESARTPPREGTSLHRRNNSVERPWGILSLFTTCSQWQLS